jgi:hypothetical protein
VAFEMPRSEALGADIATFEDCGFVAAFKIIAAAIVITLDKSE